MKRRSPLTPAITIAAVAALALTGCSPSSDGGDSAGGEVTFAGYGGAGGDAIVAAWLEPFSEETGIDAILDPSMDNSKLLQMVESGAVTWDVVEVGLDFDLTASNDNLIDIDCDVIACDEFTGNWEAMPKGVPLFIYATTLTYNTDAVETAPENWAGFFDTAAYPGKRAVTSGEGFYGVLEASLLADGVSRDDLYPLDVDRALDKLGTIKDDLIFYSSASDCIDLVSSGEAVMGTCYNGRVSLAQDEGQPVAQVWNQQIQSADYMGVPAGSENVDAAMELIAYIASVERAGALSDHIAYGPGNPSAAVSADVAADVPTANEGEGENAPIVPDWEWWNDNRAEVFETVSEWVAS